MLTWWFSSGETVTLCTVLVTLLVALLNRRDSQRRFGESQAAINAVHVLVNSQKQALENALGGAITKVHDLELMVGRSLARIAELELLLKHQEDIPLGTLHVVRREGAEQAPDDAK